MRFASPVARQPTSPSGSPSPRASRRVLAAGWLHHESHRAWRDRVDDAATRTARSKSDRADHRRTDAERMGSRTTIGSAWQSFRAHPAKPGVDCSDRRWRDACNRLVGDVRRKPTVREIAESRTSSRRRTLTRSSSRAVQLAQSQPARSCAARPRAVVRRTPCTRCLDPRARPD